jgi:hypothetical protein
MDIGINESSPEMKYVGFYKTNIIYGQSKKIKNYLLNYLIIVIFLSLLFPSIGMAIIVI